MNHIFDHSSKLSVIQVCLFGLMLALAMEALTVWTRFGLGLQSTRDTGWLASLTFGLRIHHGYIGVLLLIPACWLSPGYRNLCLMVAFGLIVSDLVHHFLVLWPITGSPEFHLVYPQAAMLPLAAGATTTDPDVKKMQSATMNQTSAGFLTRIAEDKTLLGKLGVPDAEDVQKNFRTVRFRAKIAKFLNTSLFWLGILGLILAVLLPAIHSEVEQSAKWLSEQVAFFNQSFNAADLTRIFQMGIAVGCTYCLANYRKYKLKQTLHEDILRRTLLWHESAEVKVARLRRHVHGTENQAALVKEGESLLGQFQSEEAETILRRLAGNENDKADAYNVPRLACLLKDVSIKLYSYRNLLVLFRTAAAVAFVMGVGVVAWYYFATGNIRLDTIWRIISVIVLGLAGLFYQLAKQYKNKRRNLLAALGELVTTTQPIDFRVEQLTDSLGHIDDGMQK